MAGIKDMTVSAKMNAVVMSARAVMQTAGDQTNLGVAFAMQTVARKSVELYGCDQEGILEFARDTSEYLWDTEKFGPQNGFFFENVLKGFYKENNQKSVSRVVLDMYNHITISLKYD